MKFLMLLKLAYQNKRMEGLLIEYHKIQKSVRSQRERRCVRNSQKNYLYNKVADSSHNAKDQSRIILALADKISYSSFQLMV